MIHRSVEVHAHAVSVTKAKIIEGIIMTKVAQTGPRYLVGTTNGQPGYLVYDDARRTPVLTVPTRQEAEKVAARFNDGNGTPTHTRYHIPDLPTGTRISTEQKQEQMRRKREFLSDPDFTIADIATKHQMSVNWARGFVKDEPGIRNFGSPGHDILRIPVAVYNRLINRVTKR
jgi:hypothetical protein